jgi:hypothetical protein
MKTIHKVEECVVYESNKHSYTSISSPVSSNLPIKTFLFKIASSSKPEFAIALLSSLTTLIKHTGNNHTLSSIKLKALSVVPLKTFIEKLHSPSMTGMAYTLTLKLLADIGTQLEHIRTECGLIIPFLSLEDIVVIETADERKMHQRVKSHKSEPDSEADPEPEPDFEDEYAFIFMNAEKLVQEPNSHSHSNKNELIVDVPLKVNKHTSFLPTELPENALKRLPMRLSTTSWHYSLSALCIYVLLQHKFKNGEDDIERIGRPFLHTSLYFCLKRCLKSDPEDRVLLYV